MTDERLAEQVRYYRQRAAEYDATSYGDLDRAAPRLAGIAATLHPTGRVLEIAAGTGAWTGLLAQTADSVTAVDSAPEALAIARERVTAANVRFELGDAFTWQPAERFDVVFFGFWLSHVPAERFADFWQHLAGLLTREGRALFVDEHVDEQHKEDYVAGEPEVVERTLADGNAFRIVKIFVDPPAMERALRDLGWTATVRRDGTDFVVGEARLDA